MLGKYINLYFIFNDIFFFHRNHIILFDKVTYRKSYVVNVCVYKSISHYDIII